MVGTKTSLALCAAALTPFLSAPGAKAADPYREASIPQDWALSAAKAASEACLKMGFATTVTVVDQRAQPRVQLMREGAFPHTAETSRRKAITAASRREATSIIEAENAHEPTLGAVFNEIGLITLSGGLPIIHQGAVIGGIGISGAPGEDDEGRDFDDTCGKAGLSAISHLLDGTPPVAGAAEFTADRLAIADQVAHYAQYWDGKDVEAFSALFAEDGVIHWIIAGVPHEAGPLEGRAAIRAYAEASFAGRLAGRQSRHHFSSLVFEELSSTRALTQHTYVVTHIVPGEQPILRSTGIYKIEWRKVGDAWLIAKRELFVDG